MINEDSLKDLGLSDQDALDRLTKEGFNELPSAERRSSLAIVFSVFSEPMFLLLVAAGTIYLFLGDPQEAILLLTFVIIIIGITVYQEQKTERALEALRDLSSPRALVVRNGRRIRIPGREVVRGDVIFLAEGDRVPADARIIQCISLAIDESLLTGESVPANKMPCNKNSHPNNPDSGASSLVYSGTLVVNGQGLAKVTATGVHTEIGNIGKSLKTVKMEGTPLQRETGRLVRAIAGVGLGLCALVIVAYGLTRANWLDGILAGIATAMAVLPEEFPVVLTVFLALGAWRISKHQVLTRKVPAVETLGAATVLCVDKTGTLTLNRMAVRTLFTHGETYQVDENKDQPLPESFHELVEFSILASQVDPFDPMEKAFKAFGEQYLALTEHIQHHWALVEEYPLSPELLAMSRVWKVCEDQSCIVASKGAPEAIADLCHLSQEQREVLSKDVATLASNGLRVLAVARSKIGNLELPKKQHDLPFKFLGLIGLADPIRPSVPDAIQECYSAGIRVVMITGDYPVTAQSIARQIRLGPDINIVTGIELDRLNDEELRDHVKTVDVFARVVPQQKLRLVNALKANGEVVAMTGDGVNDAPALKSAHIGIAMGGRGTDVAREAASLVLLDDDFSSIVQAVRMGRRIFDNLKKAMSYILAIHVPIAGLALIPVLLGWPLIMLPAYIVFLELIIDPACSVVFEVQPEESDVMRRPPRRPNEALFGRSVVITALLQGITVLAMVLAVFGIALDRIPELEARTLAFTALVMANLGLIFANLSRTQSFLAISRWRNRALWGITAGAVVLLGLVLYVPFLSGLFGFAQLNASELAIALIVGIASAFLSEIINIGSRRWS